MSLRRLVFGIVVLMLSAFSGWRLGLLVKPVPSTHSLPPPLFAHPEDLNFGEVWETDQLIRKIRISNPGEKAYTITRFRTSCGCTKIAPNSLTIPAGEQREITVVMDLTVVKTTEKSDSVKQPFTFLITPELEMIETQYFKIGWVLNGTIKRVIVSDVDSVDFGRRSCRSLFPLRVDFLVRSLVELHNLEVKTRSKDFTVSIRKSTKPKLFNVTVNLLRSEVRDIDEMLILYPTSTNGTVLPTRAIPIRGHIVGDVQASPVSVLVGARPVGSSFSTTITLRSLTRSPFTVNRVEVIGEGLSAKPESGTTYQIEQQIRKNGSFCNRILFTLKIGSEESSQVLGVFVEGHGENRGS